GSGIEGFECRRDAGAWASCASGIEYGALADGSHSFEVRAIDKADNADASPATYTWTVDTTSPAVGIDSGPTGLTNDPTPTFAFHAGEAGAGVECSIDNGTPDFGPCSDLSSDTPSSPLADGPHIFRVRSTDQAGNQATATRSFEVDATAPDTNITAKPALLVDSATASFSFSGDDGSGSGIESFECRIDSTGPDAWGSCTSGKEYIGLAEGSHSFEVRATDKTTNADASPATYTWTVDTKAPDTNITAKPASLVNLATASVSFTGDDLAGSGVEGFECRRDSGTWAACVSGIEYTGLADGPHGFEVRAVDKAGNADGSPATFTWTVDTAAPEASITSRPAALVNVATAHFEFNGKDSGGSGIASLQCRLDSSDEAAWGICISPQDYAGLSDGSHTFEVRAIDKATNVDQSPDSYTWTVDTTAPTTQITDHPAAIANSATAKFEFSAADAGGSGIASLQCRRDAEDWGPCSSPRTYASLAEGSHSFEVRAIDNAGNADLSPPMFSWAIDTVPPAMQIDSGPTGLTNDATPTFAFHSEAGASFECSIDDGTPDFGPCSDASSHTPSSPLSEGSHTFRVRSTDQASNQSAVATRNFTVDTTAPSAPQLSGTVPASPANDNNPKVLGTAPANTTVRLYTSPDCSGSPVATVSAVELEAGISVSVSGDSTTSLSATATTAAGSTSGCSEQILYVEDSRAPDTTITAKPVILASAATAKFEFSGDDGSGSGVESFKCRIDSSDPGDWAACVTGKEYTGFDDGSHSFEVRAVDMAGNADTSPATYAWTVDTTPPAAQIDSGPSGLTNDATPTFAFHSEAGASFECSIDDGTPEFGPCSDSASHTPSSPLAEGPHAFRLRATDAAGNHSAVATRSFTVDTTVPDVPHLSATSPASPANENNAEILGSALAGTTVRLYASADCSGSPVATVSAAELEAGISVSVPDDSTTSFSATATTAADNASGCSEPIAYVEDSTAPLTEVDSGPASPSTSSAAEFAFSGSDPGGSGTASFECRLDSTEESAWAPCGSPRSYTGLSDGAHSFQVRTIDRAGNTDGNPATYSWKIDTSAADTLALRIPVRLLRIDYDVRRGTALLLFQVPGPGTLSVSAPTTAPARGLGRAARARAIQWRKAHQIQPKSIHAMRAGKVTLPIKLSPAGRALLREHGRARVRVRISFAAKGEATVSRMLAITLKREGLPRARRSPHRRGS
ncbi:MAG: Ig-like domain-containing protein, partial [Solirubrobacterales bacterium]